MEKSVVFHSDIDNTLIYSYKHDIGRTKVGVEIYQGRTISYMTLESYERLKKISQNVLFIPTTTRTAEQYRRIDFGIETPLYALVCNGGVLLKNGREDAEWYEESLRLTEKCRSELFRAQKYLQRDGNRSFEVRNIRELFVFTKSDRPTWTADFLKSRLDLSLVDVFQNGVKVYVLPKSLHKGRAIKRMKERLTAEREALDGMAEKNARRNILINKSTFDKENGNGEIPKWKPFVIAAGDSAFDVPMAGEADLFIAPHALRESALRKVCGEGQIPNDREIFRTRGKVLCPDSEERDVFAGASEQFSDFVLRRVERIADERMRAPEDL